MRARLMASLLAKAMIVGQRWGGVRDVTYREDASRPLCRPNPADTLQSSVSPGRIVTASPSWRGFGGHLLSIDWRRQPPLHKLK